ncbi:MAG: DegV family protein [Corallococcus sp.]|nr:DegV family protein [Corallococcus sp.]
MKIKITADSTCDLPKEICEQYNISTLPLHVALGDNDYIDGETIVPDDIYNYYAQTHKLPKSGARSIEDFKDFFSGFTSQGYTVIHFNISDSMSASHANAVAASKQVEDVYVIDSKSLSTGTALLMLYACDLVQNGEDAKTIVEKVRARVDYVQASFVVDTLEFLYKGGRCSSVSYLGANLLGIKPCIEVKAGAMGVAKKYIGRYQKCIGKYVDDILEKYNNPSKRRCFVTHTKMDREIVDAVIEQVKSKGIFDEIIETLAGCTITTHCGEGTLGILYINDGLTV